VGATPTVAVAAVFGVVAAATATAVVVAAATAVAPRSRPGLTDAQWGRHVL
jgi:hypothetical protein